MAFNGLGSKQDTIFSPPPNDLNRGMKLGHRPTIPDGGRSRAGFVHRKSQIVRFMSFSGLCWTAAPGQLYYFQASS